MTPSAQHTNLADYYFGLVKNLNPNNKLDFISKLSQSLKDTDTEPERTFQSLFGAYQSEETAEEIIAEISAARVSNRNIEPL